MSDAERSAPEADTLARRLKELSNLKNQLWNPFALLIASLSGIGWLYQFVIGMGNLSYPMLGFAVISLAALLVRGGAPRLFALRTFALAIDFLFLGVLTIAILPAYSESLGWPSQLTITCTVWLWFLYFVFFDWRFHGTPGKRMLGLRLAARGAKVGIPRTALRTFLTLVLPVFAGIYAGNPFAAGGSRVGLSAALFLRSTFLLATPASILVLGGNRGFVDRLTRTEVRTSGRVPRFGARGPKARSWLIACSLPLAGGFAVGAFAYIAGPSILPPATPLQALTKPDDRDAVAVLSWTDPEGSWKSACVAPGFNDLSKEVQSIRLDVLSKNPFTAGDTDISVNPVDAANLAQTDRLSIISIKTTSWISPAGYWMIMRNLAACSGASMDDGKHNTMVIHFEQLDDYGFFVIARHQFTMLGVDRKGQTASWSMANLKPSAGESIEVSTDLGVYALLGRWGARENILNLY